VSLAHAFLVLCPALLIGGGRVGCIYILVSFSGVLPGSPLCSFSFFSYLCPVSRFGVGRVVPLERAVRRRL
jgi:hypothetical protein